jgi:hypothetical protein
MKAEVVAGAIPVETEHLLDGKVVLETTCNDYDHYSSLPGVVTYNGTTCKKTGWSSDTNRACYKQSYMVAYSK